MQVVAAPAQTTRYLTLSSFWFGVQFHWAMLIALIMPLDVERLVGSANKATYLGILIGVLAIIPLLLPPLIGVISDRIERRMPFIWVGAAVNVVGLGVMLMAPGFWIYFLGYGLVQVGNNLATSPYNALIPDVVPEEHRGTASGYMGLLLLLGNIVGFVAYALLNDRTAQYLAMALVLAASAAVLLATTPEPRTSSRSVEPVDWGAYFRPAYRDFRWVFLTRFFTEVGRTTMMIFLVYYLADVVRSFTIFGLDLGTPDDAAAILLAVLTVAGASTVLAAGRLSDRIGKKPVVYVAGALMTVTGIVFALTASFPVAVLAAVIFGLGYGAYQSVDWALGTSVLPDKTAHARDMGVWHVAMVAPQILQAANGPVVGAVNASSANAGYRLIFLVVIAFFVLGTVFVSRVRGVR
jgi:MFS family permease